MSNCDQIDELVSLEAIYDGDEDVILRLPAVELATCEGPLQLTVDITLDLGKVLALCTGALKASVVSLPLQLRAVLPPEYLAADGEPVPPQIDLSAAWLPREMRQHLCEKLDGIWCDQVGAPVLFSWIEWLRKDACTSIDLGGELHVDPQDVDIEILAALDRERRPHADRGGTLARCDHCAGRVARGSALALGWCQHTLCSACLGIVVRLHGPSTKPRCPLPQCQALITAEVAQTAREAPQPEEVVKHIIGKPLESSVVFCPCCEDLGTDTPVLTSGDSARLAAGVPEACKCPKCEWSFCGVCRSPCHPSEVCVAGAGRAKRLLQRRPPLPWGAVTEEAKEIVGKEGKKAMLLRQKMDVARQAEASKAGAAEAQQASARPKKDAAEAAEAEARMLLKLDKHVVAWYLEGNSLDAKIFAEAQDQQDVPKDYEDMRWGLVSLYFDEICGSLQKEFGGSSQLGRAPFHLRPLALARDVCQRFMQEVEANPAVEIRPAFHGSAAKNYPSIARRGLLIPGDKNELRVVNGAAHGRGVYTANVDSAWLSVGFCDEPHLLICAVLDSTSVRHVGDAMVVGKASHVVPIFEAYGDCFARVRSRKAAAAATAAQVGLLKSMLIKLSATSGASATPQAGQPPATTTVVATAPAQPGGAAGATPSATAEKPSVAKAAAASPAPARKEANAEAGAAKAAPKKKSFKERLAAKRHKFH